MIEIVLLILMIQNVIMKIESKRIKNLEFRAASYLLSKDKWPEHPSYHIDLWMPNGYYGHDEEFPEDPKYSDYRIYPDMPFCRIHKDCFKHPETCFAIASFDWDKEGYYEVHFVSDRPLEYLKTPEDREAFWELLIYGNEQLNSNGEEED